MPEIVERCCSKCGEMKHPDRIVRNRNICKDCCNLKNKENAKNKVVDLSIQKTCMRLIGEIQCHYSPRIIWPKTIKYFYHRLNNI